MATLQNAARTAQTARQRLSDEPLILKVTPDVVLSGHPIVRMPQEITGLRHIEPAVRRIGAGR